MSRILLLRPPLVFSRASYSAVLMPPIAVAYLAAALREKGHDATILDALGEGIGHVGPSYDPRLLSRGLSIPAIVSRIPRGLDAIGITAMFSQDWPHIEDLIAAIHEAYPDVPIVVGGEHATATPDYILSTCRPVRFVALGEGEETIRDFAEWLDGERPLEQVDGLCWRGEGGTIVRNAPRRRITAPDDLPWPAWDLIDLEPYFRTGEGYGVERGRSMLILATRGCPYQCTFCSNPAMWTTRYVMRDPRKVVDEIEHYQRRYGATDIDFVDLTAIIRKEWILSFCREIGRRDLRFTWQLPTGTRSEAMDGEALRAMAESGCTNVSYAPESGSEATLEAIKKKVKLPRLVESIRQAKALGLFVKCWVIIGFPGETRAGMWRSLWFMLRMAWMGVDDGGIYPFTPYPGSELYRRLRAEGKLPPLGREYFKSMMFMDFTTTPNYCENVGAWEINAYRFLGMALFYGLSYLLRPWRILRTWRNYHSRENRSDTAFEERFFALLRRGRLSREVREAGLAADAVISCNARS